MRRGPHTAAHAGVLHGYPDADVTVIDTVQGGLSATNNVDDVISFTRVRGPARDIGGV